MPEQPISRTARSVTPDELATHGAQLLNDGFRLALVAAHDDGPQLRVVYLFLNGQPDRRVELTVTLPSGNPTIPSLAALSYPASRFERELHDLFGIVPAGHPMPRRLVRHAHWPAGWHPLRSGAGVAAPFANVERFPFVTVDGDGVYEIPVGPVHAGMIEPGHFRFSVVGETILKLKARQYFTHRGIEGLFTGLDPVRDHRAVELAERISGDTSVGHCLAHCLAVEEALALALPPPAGQLRALLLELERLYNNVTDLGALAGDVGFALAQSHAGRIREHLLRINQTVTGHRLLRGAIRPGWVGLRELPDVRQLAALALDLADLAAATLAKSVVHERFSGTAVLRHRQALDLGCLGPVARASGLNGDARVDHPFTPLDIRPVTATGGDVLARYTVRRDEAAQSIALITEIAGRVTALSYQSRNPTGARPAPRTSATDPGRATGVGIVEGWRGAIVHRVEIGADGRLGRAKIVDPSWFNWPAVPVSLTDTIVPDFPLVNKSFNLSYAGNDL